MRKLQLDKIKNGEKLRDIIFGIDNIEVIDCGYAFAHTEGFIIQVLKVRLENGSEQELKLTDKNINNYCYMEDFKDE